MNVTGLIASITQILLLITMYLLVPYVVRKEQQEYVQNWVLVSFSMVFLILTIVSVRERVAVTVIILFGALVISGIAWWVPTYVPEKDQDLAVHILIIISSIMLTTISLVYSLHDVETVGWKGIGALETYIAGGKRRR